MNTLKKKIVLVLLFVASTVSAQIGIGTKTPHIDAMLEVKSTNKGLLLPRLALSSTTSVMPLSAHIEGMSIYNTATAGDVTPGFYYNDGSKWIRLASGLVADASSTTAGKIQLAGDLAGTATIPTVPGLALKVDKITGKGLSTEDYTSAEKTKLAAITGTNTGDQDLSSYATITSLGNKVDKVIGKDLSTNDYTTVEKDKLAAITGTNTGDQDLSSYATITSLGNKVDKITGKGLSTEDYTSAEKTKLGAITGTNTGDQDLSSYATITSLGNKVDKIIGKDLSTNDYTTVEKDKLAAITGTNTGDQDLSSYATITSLGNKVDKITGKGLSTEDYTSSEKTKLGAISGTNTGDQTNIIGNAGTATKLSTAININGVAFDGSTDVNVPAAAGTLTGSVLNSNVTSSSLTTVGTLTNLTVTNTINGSVSGNSATATKLSITKNINGVPFDGSTDVIITANAPALNVTNPSIDNYTVLEADNIIYRNISSNSTITFPSTLPAGKIFYIANTAGSFDWALSPQPINTSNTYIAAGNAITVVTLGGGQIMVTSGY